MEEEQAYGGSLFFDCPFIQRLLPFGIPIIPRNRFMEVFLLYQNVCYALYEPLAHTGLLF
jgi:hypothetical protein